MFGLRRADAVRDGGALEKREDAVEDERERGDQDRAAEHDVEAAQRDAGEDVLAEPAEVDVRGDRDGRDHLQRRRAQPATSSDSPSGTSTRHRICHWVMPIERAASITLRSMASKPA